jgi:4a-hydroxytetrahydrobiopterin dehydratase
MLTVETIGRIRREHFVKGKTIREIARDLKVAEGHHPDIRFGWGYVTISLQTKKIKGLHENDFIMASKIDRMLAQST